MVQVRAHQVGGATSVSSCETAVMQTAESSARASLVFSLTASLDLYLAQLDELRLRKPQQQSAKVVEQLTSTIRTIRVKSAAFPSFYSLLVELLIGHSELVMAGTRRQASSLASAQRERAESLLRAVSQALKVKP